MPDKALLCGINNYASISDLRGCLTDLEDIRDLLVSVFHFRTSNLRVLRDAEVTKPNIEKYWEWLLEDARPGDRLLLHFSGHGSYIDDRDGDEDDGADELLCLYDMDFDNRESYLLDDDIRKMTDRIPEGVSFTFIFDSCHSGTATRMAVRPGTRAVPFEPNKRPLVAVGDSVARSAAVAGPGIRGLPGLPSAPDAADRVTAPATEEDKRAAVLARFVEPPSRVLEAIARAGVRRSIRPAAKKDRMNHVLLSGSRSDQTSADAYIGGNFQGAFTYNLCCAVREAGPDSDLRDLIQDVRNRLERGNFTQVPQLEPEMISGPLFGPRADSSIEPGAATGAVGGGHSGGNAVGDLSTGDDRYREITALLQQVVDLLRKQHG